jgi:hypothetical protein
MGGQWSVASDQWPEISYLRFGRDASRTGGDAANTAGYNIGSGLMNINARGRMLKSLVKSIEKD